MGYYRCNRSLSAAGHNDRGQDWWLYLQQRISDTKYYECQDWGIWAYRKYALLCHLCPQSPPTLFPAHTSHDHWAYMNSQAGFFQGRYYSWSCQVIRSTESNHRCLENGGALKGLKGYKLMCSIWKNVCTAFEVSVFTKHLLCWSPRLLAECRWTLLLLFLCIIREQNEHPLHFIKLAASVDLDFRPSWMNQNAVLVFSPESCL